jgi:hypothetical protein
VVLLQPAIGANLFGRVANLSGRVQLFIRRRIDKSRPRLSLSHIWNKRRQKGEKTTFLWFLVGWKGPLPSLPAARSARNLEHALMPKSATSTPCPCLLLTKDFFFEPGIYSASIRLQSFGLFSLLLMPKGYPHDSNVLITKQLHSSPDTLHDLSSTNREVTSMLCFGS